MTIGALVTCPFTGLVELGLSRRLGLGGLLVIGLVVGLLTRVETLKAENAELRRRIAPPGSGRKIASLRACSETQSMVP